MRRGIGFTGAFMAWLGLLAWPRTGDLLPLVSLPSPYQSIFGINDFADPLETTFGQNSCRGVWLRERVRSDSANVFVAQCVAYQCCRCLRRVTLALMLGSHAVSNFHHAIRRGRPLEAASADYSAGLLMHQR